MVAGPCCATEITGGELTGKIGVELVVRVPQELAVVVAMQKGFAVVFVTEAVAM